MSEKTKIAWCDSTVNFWSGCTKVSAGCANCYAEALSNRKLVDANGALTIGRWGKGAPRKLHESAFKLAEKLNRKPWVCDACGCASDSGTVFCKACGYKPNQVSEGMSAFHRRRIFSLSLGDWLDPEVPIEWLARMLDTIRQCDQVTWVLCTKRPEMFLPRMQSAYSHATGMSAESSRWIGIWIEGNAPQNVVLLASVENQEMAEKRIPELLKIPAACHGLSCEPLLGPIDLTRLYWPDMRGGDKWENCLVDNVSEDAKKRYDIKWPETVKVIIVGGESGPKARPCNVEWVRSLARQGKDAGVPVFMKQWGSNPCSSELTSDEFAPYMGRIELKHPKGGDPAEWPSDLRVQQWPKGF